MAENVQITPGSGVTIGADSVADGVLGSAQIQYIKIMDGTIGGTNKAAVTANGLAVDGSGATQPISALTLPLPTGAATELTLGDIKSDLDQFTFVASKLLIDGSTVTQPISAVALPLPAGAATESTLSAVKDDVDNLDVALSTRATEATLANVKSDLDQFTFVASALLVDGSGAIQPVSGTVTANAGTGNFTVVQSVGANLHAEIDNFPSSQTVNGTVAATQSGTWTVALSSGSIEIGTVDQGSPNTLANAWPFEITDGTNILGTAVHPIRIDPTGTTTQPISGSVSVSNFPATQPISGTVTANAGTGNFTVVQATASSLNATVTGTVIATQATGTNLHTVVDSGSITVANATLAVTQSTSPWVVSLASTTITGTVAVTQSGTWNLNNISGTISLPTGASTAAKQPALGVAGTASTDVITVQGIASMTALKVDGSAVTQPISGTVSVSNFPATQAVTQSGTWTVGLTTESIEIGKVDQGTPNTLANAWPVELSDGTNLLGVSAHPVRIDPTGTTTQPISGTVTANQGTSPWVVSLASTTITGTVAVTQSTSPWVVSGTVTANAGTGTFAVSAASLPLPTGASTSAKQPALGTAGTASSDVITVQGIASMTALKVDGSAVTQPISGSVSISNFPATQPVSGTITANQGTSPWVVSLASTTITGTVAVTQSTSPWVVSGTVTSNIGTTNGLALDATVAALEVAQASTTSGQKGILQLGAVTTGSPTYTTTQTSALSLTTAGALRVDASATTQPISGSVTVANSTIAVTQSGTWNLNNISGTISLPTGASTEATLSSLNGKVTAVNTGAVTISTALPAGTNVIGHVIADSGSTTAVTGTVTVAQATAANLNATVVGTVTANAGTGNFTVAQATGTNLHTVVDSGTITSITNPLPAGTNVLGHVITDTGSTTAVTGTVTVAQATATNLNATVAQGTAASATNKWPVCITDSGGVNQATVNGSGQLEVVAPTITKGTQGATGFTTQDFKDSGRTYITFTADAIAGVTTEALVSFTLNKQGTTTATQTNYTITSGKTLRVQSITVGIQATVGTGEWVRLKLRHNTAGATTTTSALVYTVACGTVNATTGTSDQVSVPIPDGLEFFGNGTQTIGISHLSSTATNSLESITVCGYEY